MRDDTTKHRSAQTCGGISEFEINEQLTNFTLKYTAPLSSVNGKVAVLDLFMHMSQTLCICPTTLCICSFWFLLASRLSGWATKTGKVFDPDEKLAIRGFAKTQGRISSPKIKPEVSNHSIIESTFYRLSCCCRRLVCDRFVRTVVCLRQQISYVARC